MSVLMPKTREEQVQFFTAVGVALFVGIVSTASVIVGLLVIIENVTRPRIHYTNADLLTSAIVCPGDALSFTTQLDIEVEDFRPSQILITVSIWDIENQRTIQFDETPRYSAWTEPTIINYIEMHTVPDIPPGRYEIRHATLMFTGGNDVISIPFTVSGSCK